MTRLTLVLLPLASALVVQSPIAQRESIPRRSVFAAAAAAAAAVVAPFQVRADTIVPKTKVGVTPGGVRYFDKVSENSCSPFNPCTAQAGDFVKIKYKSYLSNGAMFDSSENPGRKPLAVKYKASPPQMIPGWEEALEGMQQGQTRIIQVPASMAYGDKGIKVETKDGSTEYLVQPGERLQFELTLVQVALPPP